MEITVNYIDNEQFEASISGRFTAPRNGRKALSLAQMERILRRALEQMANR